MNTCARARPGLAHLAAAAWLALAGCMPAAVDKAAAPPADATTAAAAGTAAASGFHAIDISGAQWGQGFTLQDPQGRSRSLAEFKGRAVLLFFGFTQCPDVCPTALARAADVMQRLGPAQAARVQVIFVTVDPDRDTAPVLAAYTQAFHPGFLGLMGDAAATERTARDFKVFYRRVPTGSSYTMDHTALSFVFDPQGRLRLAVKHEQSAADLADDLRRLL